jgi:hypothetical protein
MTFSLPRHRSAPAAPAPAQLHLHVRRLETAPGCALTPEALRTALAEHLAGHEPPFNHATPADHLARQLLAQVAPLLKGKP